MDTRAREDVGCTCDISARLSGHVPTLRVRGECVTRRGAAWPHQLLTTGAGKRGSHARADRCVVRVAVALSACSRCGRRDPPRGRLANKSRRDGAAMQLHPVWSSRRRPRWSAEVAVVHACVGPHICTAACVVHGLLPPRWWGRELVRETASFGMTKNLGRRIPVAGPPPRLPPSQWWRRCSTRRHRKYAGVSPVRAVRAVGTRVCGGVSGVASVPTTQRAVQVSGCTSPSSAGHGL